MKIRNILISGLGVMALTACSDYLDVDSPSKYSLENIFSSEKDASTALNGVYADMLESNTFGQAYTYSLILNSDVDYCSNSNNVSQSNTPKRYDCDRNSSTVASVWKATYAGIESANNFCYNLENSEIYAESIKKNEKNISQMLGEAKVIRAMYYYELMCYWGDVPFTFEPTSSTNDFAPAITSRDDIAKNLIEDLAAIAPRMNYATENSEGIERISKEACWAMISRIALQASGYSLRHKADDANTFGYMGRPGDELRRYFLEKARDYADSVITSGTHSLSSKFQDEFVNECNLKVAVGDDPIFEIPFAVEASGSIGYNQGPQCKDNNGQTEHAWGKASGSQSVESFYRYSFLPGDTRKDATIGWWYYDYQGTPIIRSSYSFFNNKWSKLYNDGSVFTKISSSNTGINFPYLRYAEVLLNRAEADVQLTGTTDLEKYVQPVRNRAFYGSDVAAPAVEGTDSASMMKAILDERKWEFAGENIRWKDLVRNNMLAETLYWTFVRNYAVAEDAGVGISWDEMVENHDGIKYFTDKKLPNYITYIYIKNPANNTYFANKSLPVLYILNKDTASTDLKTVNDKKQVVHAAAVIKQHPQYWFDDNNLDYKAILKPNDASVTTITWSTDQEFYAKWYDEEGGHPQKDILYSFFGFIRGGLQGDESSTYFVTGPNSDDVEKFSIDKQQTKFPVVRYLLPIPREAVQRGGYTNYYGYGL